MIFAVDCMLGKLAKWLKILGFDTLYFNRIDDDELLQLSADQGRILLTRDHGLFQRAEAGAALLITSEDWRDQLRQVAGEFDLRRRMKPYSLCLECNLPLKRIPANKARNLVNPHILKTSEDFSLCPGCGRNYWRGSHHRDMAEKIRRLLESRAGDQDKEKMNYG